MFKAIAWGVTGAGSFLRESFEVILKIKEELKLRVTTFISEAGLEVVRMYGLLKELKEISPGGYYEEIIDRGVSGMSHVYSGRFYFGRYVALVVSPATSNTIAKIVHGIADTVVTDAVSQAIKAKTPVYIVPSDLCLETIIPCQVNRDLCDGCKLCLNSCPVEAIELIDGLARINLLKCVGCSECVGICPKGAITCWRRVKVYPREVDLENLSKLRRLKGVRVLSDPFEVVNEIKEVIKV